MRAAATLRLLSRSSRVTLLIAPGSEIVDQALASELRARCERVVHLGMGETLLPRRHFDIVHVYRLAALSTAEPWLRRAAAVHLDLDDLESVSNRRLATLAWASGKEAAAHRAEDAAERTSFLENDALARFQRVYVCAESARQTLLKRHAAGAEVVVLPNRLPAPLTTPFPPPHSNSFILVFVATLGDEANEDAMHFFSTGILPFIQAGADRPVTLRIVGAGAGPAVQRLDSQAGVEVIGEVEDVTPWYRDAHVAIAPLRAGSACRIKILEAFTQQRPVVATRIGIDGIAAADGRHALIADDPGTFATACLRFLHEPELSARITQEAFRLFEEQYAEGDG